MGSMYMCKDILTRNLTTTVYRDFWSVDGIDQSTQFNKRRTSRRDGERSRARQKVLQDSAVICCSATSDSCAEGGYFTETGDSDTESMVGKTTFSRLDPATLKYIGWAPSSSDESRDIETTQNDKDYENLCMLSKVEFKKLTEQVRDVNMNLRNKFRTSAYQKLYQQPSPGLEAGAQIYRSQLAASLKAFKPKDWPPLNTKECEVSFLRCKPIQQTNERNPTPPPSRYSSPACRIRRPRSVPANAARRSDTPSDVRPGPFDTLNPRVLSNLLGNSYNTTHSFGDRVSFNENTNDEDEEDKSDKVKKNKEKDEDNSTSGIESSQTDDDSSSSSSDDEDSDYEPEVDRNRQVPDLILRPEKLDSFVVPDSCKGWRKYDFDADTVEYPAYEFAEPIPEPFNELDLRQMAKLKWNWRDHTKAKAKDNVDCILDRLVDLERLQIETEEWETKRFAQVNKKSKRAVSAKTVLRDRRCCNKCLQPACVGDCPEKNVQLNICEFCRQTFCVNSLCKDTKYDQRMRQPRTDDDKHQNNKLFPRACKSCQLKHNAKLINANNLLLGRPKSGNATFSRGQASYKPKDMRPRPDTPVSPDLQRDFERLGLQPTLPPRSTSSLQPRIQRPRSRNGMIPGKTFYSQRRDSITDNEKEALTNIKRKRVRSIKVRRPKTAV